MRIDGFIGNSRFTNQILKCDAAYVESIAKNYFGENLQIKAEKVLNSWYPNQSSRVIYVVQVTNAKAIDLHVFTQHQVVISTPA